MPIFNLLQKLWEKLNLRGVIILSLSLQVCLVILAPLRKRVANRMVISLTWSAYLVADLAADYVLGLLTKGRNSDSQGPAADLLAFWAPFLLVHLGGPDPITAFALEDNELWMRHLLNLLFQLGAVGYAFYQSLPDDKLIVPTILVFIDGLIKYIERIHALFKASFSKFRDSMLKARYARRLLVGEDYYSKRAAGDPGGRLDDIMVKSAHHYFTTFKVLLVDLVFTISEGKDSINFFRSMTAKDAFKVVVVELNFIYDVLYTKADVIRCRNGYIFRAISFISALTALALFCSSPKHDLHEYDIMITYTLLIGAISLDTIALLMLIFSNWTMAAISLSDKSEENSFVKKFFVKTFLMFKSENSIFSKYVLCGRCPRTISNYNLLDQFMKNKKRPKWVDAVISCLHVEIILEYLRSEKGNPFSDSLRDLIFDEVKQKAERGNCLTGRDSLKSMLKVRGEWVLNQYKEHNLDTSNLLPFVREVDYGESLLLWHIATELCYNNEDPCENKDQKRTNSKILSDYMLYLLIKQPNMTSTVSGIALLRYDDTRQDTEKMFREMSSSESRDKTTACRALLSMPPPEFTMFPQVIRGEKKSVLPRARSLAKELLKFGNLKWEIMSRVWVELLGHAAIHCRPFTHAQQLGKSGELISLVWLLMVQLGLSDQIDGLEGPY